MYRRSALSREQRYAFRARQVRIATIVAIWAAVPTLILLVAAWGEAAVQGARFMVVLYAATMLLTCFFATIFVDSLWHGVAPAWGGYVADAKVNPFEFALALAGLAAVIAGFGFIGGHGARILVRVAYAPVA